MISPYVVLLGCFSSRNDKSPTWKRILLNARDMFNNGEEIIHFTKNQTILNSAVVAPGCALRGGGGR